MIRTNLLDLTPREQQSSIRRSKPEAVNNILEKEEELNAHYTGFTLHISELHTFGGPLMPPNTR
jgi:hypothetical protein